MGTQGVPLNIPKSTISLAIKKHKGVITRMREELKAGHTALLTVIRKDPDLSKELEEERLGFSDEMCDLAENALIVAVSQTQDLGSAISSAKFILNNKGKDRGYAPIVHGAPTNDSRLDAIDGNSADLVNESK